jgi:hypothetical protein
MKATKKTTQLPSRSALTELGQSQRTIADYAKASPITERVPNPAAIIKLAKR